MEYVMLNVHTGDIVTWTFYEDEFHICSGLLTAIRNIKTIDDYLADYEFVDILG